MTYEQFKDVFINILEQDEEFTEKLFNQITKNNSLDLDFKRFNIAFGLINNPYYRDLKSNNAYYVINSLNKQKTIYNNSNTALSNRTLCRTY